MKKILCYGDSNTFGFNPKDGTRFDDNTRWTSLLGQNLGEDFVIIEEGANNRTGFSNNPAGFLFSAQRHFPKIISKAKDIDILILAIGTNDLQFHFNIGFNALEHGLETLLQEAKKKARNIILVPPVILSENILKHEIFNKQFDETSISKSKKVGRIYKKLANIYGCFIFDFNEFVKPSEIDGLHYDETGHMLIAKQLAEFIKKGQIIGK